MGLPSASVLLDPVLCYPAWHTAWAKYGGRQGDVVRSGCSTSGGNVQCDPAGMARAAGARLGVDVSLEAYTLARYLASEVGSGPVEEKVAVAQAAINRACHVERLAGGILSLLLYRQKVGHPNRGYYGPIHGAGGVSTAPYGRWAATSQDPTVGDILLARAILDGTIDPGFNKGADDQDGPEYFDDPVAFVRRLGASKRYWVGPLPGVDHWRTFQSRRLDAVSPTSVAGKALIARGVAALSKAKRPNWANLPTCQPAVAMRSSVAVAGLFVVAATVGLLAVGSYQRFAAAPAANV